MNVVLWKICGYEQVFMLGGIWRLFAKEKRMKTSRNLHDALSRYEE
jgi:hypothetical protein